MADFFISYTAADKAWAEWVAYVLEEEGLTVLIQAWDFRPGSNFVLEMQSAAAQAGRTIVVLSPDYLKSQFASPEWAAAFAQDPQGEKRVLVPIVVRECNPTGLLRPIIHINLVNLTETAARSSLIAGLNATRAKPSDRPVFPGAVDPRKHKYFPGTAGALHTEGRSTAYMPGVKQVWSDADRRRFSRQSFETIKAHFESALYALSQRNNSIEFDLQSKSQTEFSVEIFLGGKSKCSCHVWQGGLHSNDGVSYAEGLGSYGARSFNEVLALNEDGLEFNVRSLMGFSSGQLDEIFDLKKLTKEQAAEYLWRRFVAPLER
jgi:hypothetical protein